MKLVKCCVVILLVLCVSCTMYRPMKEIKFVGFSDNVKKGKSVGRVEGDHCVYHILGHWLGAQPTLTKALNNARYGKKTTVADSFTSGDGIKEGGVRYFNNVRYKGTGFDLLGLFGKRCLAVIGRGYK